MGLWKDKIRKDWRYSFLYRGKSYAGGGFKTRGQAEETRTDRRRELKILSPTRGGMALSLGVSLYLDQAEKRFRLKTYEYKRYVLNSFLKFRGDGPVSHVTPQALYSYLSTRPSNKNFNRHRKDLLVFFNFLKNNLRQIGENPVSPVQRMPETQSRKYIPPKEDILKVLEASGKDRAFLLVLLHTMARVDEILGLTWEDINFDVSTIRLWTRKTSDGSTVADVLPMNAELREILFDLWKKRRSAKWVFYFGRNHGRYNRRPKLMKSLCQKAKIKAFGFHSLRHFGATFLASKGVAHKTLSGLLRHRSLATTEIYLQTLDEAEREAVKKMEGIFMLADPSCVDDVKGDDYGSNSAKSGV